MDSSLFTVVRLPASNPDGTLTALVVEPVAVSGAPAMLTCVLPARSIASPVAGRYFLARCGAQSEWERAENWQTYFRRPLFAAGRPRPSQEWPGAEVWCLIVPPGDDPGYRWLAHLGAGETLNLVGPLGNGFVLPPTTRHLLVVAEGARLVYLLPLLDAILDCGGAVSVVVVGEADHGSLQAMLPMAVELRTVRPGEDWLGALTGGVRWADQLCLALHERRYVPLAELICEERYRLDPGFALALVEAELACGFGACLACVVPLGAGRLTRACVHGPVFDLLELTEGR